MAHFAELDENNLVKRVVVVANKDCADADGVEKEYIGAAYLERLLGGVWKQTSYHGNIRKHYAGIGYTYDAARDAFIPPQPYPSWSLDDDCNWQAPIPMPNDEFTYVWDEANQQWEISESMSG